MQTEIAGATKVQIAVLTNGFVYVGHVAQRDGYVEIVNAKNIRRWGTTKGLGQLAIQGPQKETILDETGVVRAPLHSVIFLIDCQEKAWRQIFG